eukprot:TRINITY_DN29990_c0_g1_i1.p1 TRINITY_DN29990_c0_g1~~TRINITY_DN29990_c0_g1_i1.p1  ORF type:complete len:930 (-),score=176.35 TRINITY_DN29990_c0_g1_i1:60-2849(-)
MRPWVVCLAAICLVEGRLERAASSSIHEVQGGAATVAGSRSRLLLRREAGGSLDAEEGNGEEGSSEDAAALADLRDRTKQLQEELLAIQAKRRSGGNASRSADRAGSEQTPEEGVAEARELRVTAGTTAESIACLTHESKDHTVTLQTCRSSPHQLWFFQNGNIRVQQSSRCLAAELPDASARRRRRRVGRLLMKSCVDSPNMKWMMNSNVLQYRFNETECAQAVPDEAAVYMKPCDAMQLEPLQSFVRAPALPCLWDQWQLWSDCTLSCNGGTQKRLRDVAREAEKGGDLCMGDNYQIRPCGLTGCPRSCEWGPWEPWTACTRSCGGGQRERLRLTAVEALFGGDACVGSGQLTEACATEPCPIDCAWHDWEEWTDCSQSCGGGETSRERHIAQLAMYGGKPCAESGQASSFEWPSDLKLGPEVQSPKDAFGQWSRCEAGYKVLGVAKFEFLNQVSSQYQDLVDLECSVEENGCRVFCKGSECKFWPRCALMGRSNTMLGNLVRSPMNEWGPFSTCPESEGSAVQPQVIGLAKLSVLDAAGPSSGVNDFFCNATGCRVFCADTDCEVQSMCGSGLKVSNGKVVKSSKGEWGEYSTCPQNSAVAGLAKIALLDPIGNENVDRWECNEYGCRAWCYGSDCTIVTRCLVVDQTAGEWQKKTCGTGPCPVDCLYSTWGMWDQCSRTCESGLRAREREVEVQPLNGGKLCSDLGPAKEQQACSPQACPVDCVWSDWGEFEQCSVTCTAKATSGGQRTRRRIIARLAKNEGKECLGSYEESERCGLEECPIDCVFGMWQGWGECVSAQKADNQPVYCGGDGSRSRVRAITLEAMHGGKQCVGSTTEIDGDCAAAPCPVDCVFDTWTTWSACSRDCGVGSKTRFRSPTVPMMYGGTPCSGPKRETTRCVVKMVCADALEKNLAGTSLLEQAASEG